MNPTNPSPTNRPRRWRRGLAVVAATGVAVGLTAPPTAADSGGLVARPAAVVESAYPCVPELSISYLDFSPFEPGSTVVQYVATFEKDDCPLYGIDDAPEPLGLGALVRLRYRHRPWLTSLPWQPAPSLAHWDLTPDDLVLWEDPGGDRYVVSGTLNITDLIEAAQTQFRLDVDVLHTENITGDDYTTGWIDAPNLPRVNERFDDRPDDLTANPGQRQP